MTASTAIEVGLGGWYRVHGRHELPWRGDRDRWRVLVSEVALQQTPVARVGKVWTGLVRALPDPLTVAALGPAAAIRAWGTLGYPRRARRLWEAARIISTEGWPSDLTALPGVGAYTAAAVRAQADGWDAIVPDVNIRRVVERVAGTALDARAASDLAVVIGAPLAGRDRLLALMDLGASVCTRRAPTCATCPLYAGCASQGARDGEGPRRQAAYVGSFRERRGHVLARLRAESNVRTDELDPAALASLSSDGLAVVHGAHASLPEA